jgi:hypothetical protein
VTFLLSNIRTLPLLEAPLAGHSQRKIRSSFFIRGRAAKPLDLSSFDEVSFQEGKLRAEGLQASEVSLPEISKFEKVKTKFIPKRFPSFMKGVTCRSKRSLQINTLNHAENVSRSVDECAGIYPKKSDQSGRNAEVFFRRPSQKIVPTVEQISGCHVKTEGNCPKMPIKDKLSGSARSFFQDVQVTRPDLSEYVGEAVRRLDSFDSGSKDSAEITDLIGNLATLLVLVKEKLGDSGISERLEGLLQEIDELRGSVLGDTSLRESFEITGGETRETRRLSPEYLPRRILFADDMEMACKLHSRMSKRVVKKVVGPLGESTSPTESFRSGRRIVQHYVESCKENLEQGVIPPHSLIFLDNTMPDGEDSGDDAGLNAVLAIRDFESELQENCKAYNPATIILLTGDNLDPHSEGALKSDGLIIKPATNVLMTEAFLRHQDKVVESEKNESIRGL